MMSPLSVAVVDLRDTGVHGLRAAAELLVVEFAEHWPGAWPTMQSALAEVQDCLGTEYLARAAIDGSRGVVGWAGARPSYGGRVWELHPLVVRREWQRRAIGRRLVADIEAQAAQRGGLTLWVGTDDEDGQTSLANVDLYEDLPAKVAGARLGGHPSAFYRRLGFSIIGVMPDANGPGKPDIYMAKRLFAE